jgi:hypothetical protein
MEKYEGRQESREVDIATYCIAIPNTMLVRLFDRHRCGFVVSKGCSRYRMTVERGCCKHIRLAQSVTGLLSPVLCDLLAYEVSKRMC